MGCEYELSQIVGMCKIGSFNKFDSAVVFFLKCPVAGIDNFILAVVLEWIAPSEILNNAVCSGSYFSVGKSNSGGCKNSLGILG